MSHTYWKYNFMFVLRVCNKKFTEPLPSYFNRVNSDILESNYKLKLFAEFQAFQDELKEI